MASPESHRGFIVHAFSRAVGRKTHLYLIGRLEEGTSFGAVFSGVMPTLYLRESDGAAAASILAVRGARIERSDRKTMDGEPSLLLSCLTPADLSRAAEALGKAGIRTYEADLHPHESFLIDRAIHGSVTLSGKRTPGRRVTALFVDPEIAPADWEPRLSTLSLDIETDPRGREIWAIGLSHREVASAAPREEVLLFSQAGPARAPLADPVIHPFSSEREMLAAFVRRIRELDPDIVTGWNVVDFDFSRILERLRAHGLSLALGRSREPCTYLPGEARRPGAVVIPGRQLLDGMRLMRSGPQRFADQSLETAAREVLGRGKTIDAPRGRAKIEEIIRLYREDPAALCRYCLDDARLVHEILERTGLLELTIRRCRLIGIPLSRAWTSIAAFDFIYIEALHRRGIVAPTLGVDALPLNEAPGGAIIPPRSGLYDNVYVFDFQSLYPSIIRTFNIDPLSYLPDGLLESSGGSPTGGQATGAPASDESAGTMLHAPNGATFRRVPGILPGLLDRFFESRAEAKRSGDAVASYVYKIILNSFYGVLGAPGCRFAGSQLAGAITGFGHHILYWCRDFLAAKGLQTLYGDTDSLFVLSKLPPGTAPERVREWGEELCSAVNEKLREHLAEKYRVESRLRLQFEKLYLRFFIPPLRGRASAPREPEEAAPGRSKGYAGALLGLPGEPVRIEVRGMEAVRRDWTQAAKEFQLALLRLLFEARPRTEIVAYVRSFLAEILEGKRDAELVYRKALRKSVDEYARSLPAHVKAARRLKMGEQAGLIDYLWTKEGPQPVGNVSAPIDYDHYLEKQIKPIAAAFSEVIGVDLVELFHRDRQLPLF